MRKWWRKQSSLDRYLISNALWGFIFVSLGAWWDNTYLLVAGAIFVSVPGLLFGFFRAVKEGINRGEIIIEFRKEETGRVPEPPTRQ